MADFTDEDRDRVRDYFGYTWANNKLIENTLKTAKALYGDPVVEYVVDRLDELDQIQATLKTNLTAGVGGITQVDVDQEVAVSYAPGSFQAGNYQQRQKLLNEIAGAIDLALNSFTPLERS